MVPVVRTGDMWWALPAEVPPWQTEYFYSAHWHDQGVTCAFHDALRGRLRTTDGCDVPPRVAIVDS